MVFSLPTNLQVGHYIRPIVSLNLYTVPCPSYDAIPAQTITPTDIFLYKGGITSGSRCSKFYIRLPNGYYVAFSPSSQCGNSYSCSSFAYEGESTDQNLLDSPYHFIQNRNWRNLSMQLANAQKNIEAKPDIVFKTTKLVEDSDDLFYTFFPIVIIGAFCMLILVVAILWLLCTATKTISVDTKVQNYEYSIIGEQRNTNAIELESTK